MIYVVPDPCGPMLHLKTSLFENRPRGGGASTSDRMITNDIFRIHCLGRWAPSQVHIVFSNRDYILPGNLPARAQQFWENAAANRRHHLFNGALCRLDAFEVSEEALQLHLSRTCYRDLLFSNAHVSEIAKKFGEQALARALGISVVIETADGFLPLMRRSASLGEGAGMLDVFGGHIHPVEHARDGVPDVFYAIADEVQTELGLMPDQCDEFSCIGILENLQTRKPEMVFETSIALTMEELRATAAQAKEGAEYVELLAVPAQADEVRKYLQQQWMRFAPSGYGCLALFAVIKSRKMGTTFWG